MNIAQLNIQEMLPEIFLLVLSLIILGGDMVLKREQKRRLWDIAFFGLLIILILIAGALSGSWVGFGDAFFGQAITDGLTVFLRLIIVACLFITFIFAVDWLSGTPDKIGIFIFLTMISSLGALVLASAGDLLIMLIGLEILSIPLYILAGFQRESKEGREASFKYFILGSFASAFFALGILLTFMATSTTNLAWIKFAFIENKGFIVPLKIAVILLISTLAFKGGLMPFYAWIPDVYRGSSDYVVGFMAAITKASVFAALIRLGVAFAPSVASILSATLAFLFVVTVIVGNLMALWQDDVKRMLAYSSIAHAGYLMLGLMAFNQLGLSAIIFYLVIYSFSVIGSFIVTGIVHQFRGGYTLVDFEGLREQSPYAALAMAIFMTAFSGIPPIAGFFAKLFLFNGAVDTGLWKYVVIASITSLIGVYYYFRVIMRMYMYPIPDEVRTRKIISSGFYTNTALLLASILVVVLGIIPGRFYDSVFLFLKTLFI